MTVRQRTGQIITFYSYKGGTGRTMALANVACLLARQQDRGSNGVLMIDWDLEAPGLHHFFAGHMQGWRFPQSTQTRDRRGLIDLFVALDKATPPHGPEGDAMAEEVAHSALQSIDLDDYILPTDIEKLSLIKAGAFDPGYSGRVNAFQWEALFQRSPLLVSSFAEELSTRYSFVLIDSRTGLTDITGISTMLMPEKLVVVFTPNRQSLTGMLDLVRRATKYRRQSDDLRPLLVFPLPSRIEESEPQLKDDWRLGNAKAEIEGFQPLFEDLFRDVYGLAECHLNRYFDEVQLQHRSRYAYGEEIAVLSERAEDVASLSRRYRQFANRLVNSDAPWVELPEVDQVAHAQVVAEVVETRRAAEVMAQRAKRVRWALAALGAFSLMALAIALFRYQSLKSDVLNVTVDELTVANQLAQLVHERKYSEATQLFGRLRASDYTGVGYSAYPGAAFAFDQAFNPDEAVKVLDLLEDRLKQDAATGRGYLAPGQPPVRLLRNDFKEFIPRVRSSQVADRMRQIVLRIELEDKIAHTSGDQPK